MTIKNIAVIGAGVMGQGVAYQFAKFDYNIILVDIATELLDTAGKNIRNIERLDKLLHKSASTVKVSDKITFTTDLQAISSADFIIENIRENIPLKEALYQEMKAHIADHALLAVNTSAVSITRLASFFKTSCTGDGHPFYEPCASKTYSGSDPGLPYHSGYDSGHTGPAAVRRHDRRGGKRPAWLYFQQGINAHGK